MHTQVDTTLQTYIGRLIYPLRSRHPVKPDKIHAHFSLWKNVMQFDKRGLRMIFIIGAKIEFGTIK